MFKVTLMGVLVTMKKIAVLMATYNGEAYLAEMLDSLAAQKNVEFCCYIHDDGSVDGTLDIIQNYIFRYPKIFFLLEQLPLSKFSKFYTRNARNFYNIKFIT